MNQEDVIRMAREAGARAWQNKNCDVEYLFTVEQIDRLLAAEREACAELCERMGRRINSLDIRVTALEMAAENIRARSKP